MIYLVHPHFPTGVADVLRFRNCEGVKEPGFAARLRELNTNSLIVVDQTYLGFTECAEDDELLETLAQFNNNVVLIRSLSKVEGLAGLRLGYAKSTAATAQLIAETLPFSGGLYISEMALEGALAAVKGPLSRQHRNEVLCFYEEEQLWLRQQLEALGLETFGAKAPFFVLRGPRVALQAVVKARVFTNNMLSLAQSTFISEYIYILRVNTKPFPPYSYVFCPIIRLVAFHICLYSRT